MNTEGSRDAEALGYAARLGELSQTLREESEEISEAVGTLSVIVGQVARRAGMLKAGLIAGILNEAAERLSSLGRSEPR